VRTLLIDVSGAERPMVVNYFNRWVTQHSWCMSGEGYPHTRLGRDPSGKDVLIYAHVLLVAPPPGLTVDHIDRDPLNNLESNLRLATKQEQLHNQGLRRNNTSGFKGVSWIGGRQRWGAQIKTPDGRHLMRYFHTPEEAAECYDAWALQYFGEFACTNVELGLLV
jgi:hypothetical protein